MKISWLESYERQKPFPEYVAWTLFKYAAFAEAFGWFILLLALPIQFYHLPGSSFAIPIAGSLHGSFVIIYFLLAIALYPSLGWSRKKAGIAILASIPPFGSLIFELIAVHERTSQVLSSFRRIIVSVAIFKKNQVLTIEPRTGKQHYFPGGYMSNNENPPITLTRTLTELFGVKPIIQGIYQITSLEREGNQCLEITYTLTNETDFYKLNFKKIIKEHSEIENIGFTSL